MTREEFIAAYAARSNRTVESLSWLVALPCACDSEMCKGWAMVENTPERIAAHNELYAPGEAGEGE